MCLSVCEHISGATRAIFTNFLRMLPMPVARSFSGRVTKFQGEWTARPCTWPCTGRRPAYTACIGRLHGLYTAVYRPCTRAVNTAVYTYTTVFTAVCTACKRPCTRSCTRIHGRVYSPCTPMQAVYSGHKHGRIHGRVTTYKRPCLRLVYTTVYIPVHRPCTGRVHGLYAVYTSCTRAVNTAVYSRTRACTRPCACCKQPCTRSCTCPHFPYTAVDTTVYGRVHGYVHGRVRGCVHHHAHGRVYSRVLDRARSCP